MPRYGLDRVLDTVVESHLEFRETAYVYSVNEESLYRQVVTLQQQIIALTAFVL